MVNFAITGCNNDCKKTSIQRIFSCQRKTKDKKNYFHFAEEGFKRHLEVIILRITTER